MTLSGKNGKREELEAARKARQDRAAAQQARKPWLMPLIITVAVAILAYVIFLMATGQIKAF